MEDRLQRLAQQLPDDVDAMLICEAVNRAAFVSGYPAGFQTGASGLFD